MVNLALAIHFSSRFSLDGGSSPHISWIIGNFDYAFDTCQRNAFIFEFCSTACIMLVFILLLQRFGICYIPVSLDNFRFFYMVYRTRHMAYRRKRINLRIVVLSIFQRCFQAIYTFDGNINISSFSLRKHNLVYVSCSGID